MKKRTLITPLATLATSLAFATPTDIDNNSLPKDTTKVIDIEEVVVIATPKENNRLRQQPVSASSFSQNEMRSRHITSIKSLSNQVPNLFIPDYGSKLTTSVYVRGIGSRINTPAVGLYVDNIPYIDKSAFDFNYSDIERIDVMRGPQGTLYGRNTMGGLIRVYTKSPFSYQGTDIRLSAATYNNYKASLTHYHRISDQFAFSTGIFYEHKGGFFKNNFNGKRIDTDNEFGGRIRAIWLPTENNRLDFTINYEYTNQGGYPYEYVGRVDGKEEDRKEFLNKIDYNNECGYKRNLINAGLNYEYQADNFTLSSVTGFQYLYDRMDLDQDFTSQDLYTMMQKQNSKTISEELVLKSKPNRRWQWTTGISGFYQSLHTDGPVTFRSDGIAWLNSMINTYGNQYMPVIEQGPMTMSMQFNDRIKGNELYIGGDFDTPILNGAVFHQSTFNDLFGLEGLSLTAGLRLDYEKLKFDYNTGYDFVHTYSLSGTISPMGMTIDMIPEADYNAKKFYIGKLKHDYVQLLPKFALQYNFNKRNNVYVTVSKGYRSGGYNLQMFSDILQGDMQTSIMKDVADVTIPAVNNVAMIDDETKGEIIGILNKLAAERNTDVRAATLYKPEYSWNYEVGTHLTMLKGKLQADMAAFYMDTHDQQISRFVNSGLGRITVNAGKSRSIGFEAAVRAQVSDVFSLNGNYGYTYATFTDYTLSDTQNYDGNYVPFVPKHTFSIGAQYVFNLKKGAIFDNIAVNANYRAAGRIYWTESNDASQALYGTLNGRIDFNKGDGQISLWINNALDKKYEAFYFQTMNRGFAQYGRPLQVGIDIRCRF
ncbi:TonB-dependent receptor [uncultured Bacteroides sp.]|uniref:TonB-dependent receptor n=1 Tax=uncultured Bacteroides sp. TaxID=162156 RepID=UPI0026092CC1|nr:TonB-dependent receptor [uncultured Bacteroides sp.]